MPFLPRRKPSTGEKLPTGRKPQETLPINTTNQGNIIILTPQPPTCGAEAAHRRSSRILLRELLRIHDELLKLEDERSRNQDIDKEIERLRSQLDTAQNENTALKKENAELLSKLNKTQRTKTRILQQKLNDFWSRNIKFPNATSEKAKTLIGSIYEQYVGWSYENSGWDVDYYGMTHGLNDGGTDLICKRNNEIRIIQCKNWSPQVQVRTASVNQLQGTVTLYKNSHSSMNVRGFIYTTTTLDTAAKNAAHQLGIRACETVPLKPFPSVKCRKSNGFYYLPEDTQYFRIILDAKAGDIYCNTVAQAEAAGFTY